MKNEILLFVLTQLNGKLWQNSNNIFGNIICRDIVIHFTAVVSGKSFKVMQTTSFEIIHKKHFILIRKSFKSKSVRRLHNTLRRCYVIDKICCHYVLWTVKICLQQYVIDLRLEINLKYKMLRRLLLLRTVPQVSSNIFCKYKKVPFFFINIVAHEFY